MILIDVGVVVVLVVAGLFIYAETRTTTPGAAGQTAQSYAVQGIAAFKVNEFGLAKRLFTQEIDAAGSSKNARAIGYYNLGTAEAQLSQESLSIADYTVAVKLVPNFPTAWITLAAAESKLGNTSSALKDYNSLLAISPTNSQALFSSGILLYDQGDKSLGVSRIKEAIALKPSLVTALPKNIVLN